MKGIHLLIHFFIMITFVSCLPDSIDSFNEEPPSDPYKELPKFTTEVPTGIDYDKTGPHKLQRFIPSQSSESSENNEDDSSFSLKLYSTSSGKAFTNESEMTFSIDPREKLEQIGLEFNGLTGEVSGKPTSFLSETRFTVKGKHASDADYETTFDLSVTTKIDSITYKQKIGKYILLELSSIVEIEPDSGEFYLYNDSGLFSSYHPIRDNGDYKTIINQDGYKADVSVDTIDDTYNTVIVKIQSEDANFKAGDFIDIGNHYFGKKNKIEKVIHFFNNTDSTVDLAPTLNPPEDKKNNETLDYSVSPPLNLPKYNISFSETSGDATADGTPLEFLPTQFNFTVRNQNGETQSTSLWITVWNKKPNVVDNLNYKLNTNDVFKVILEDSTNFKVGESLSTSKEGTKADIISKNFGVIQLKVTDATTGSSFKMGTEVDNSSDYIWSETKISTSERIFQVGNNIDIEPDHTADLQDFTISPSLPSDLTFDATTGRIDGTATSTINNANFTVKAKNILGKEISTVLTLSIIDPPKFLSYSRDAILKLSETDASVDKRDHIVSSGGAKGIVKEKIHNSPSDPFLLVKVLEGEFKKNEQIDTAYNYNKPVASIKDVEYYNAAFKLTTGTDATNGQLILNGNNEDTADHIAEIVHIDPSTDVYVRIVKGSFSENNDYYANNTQITIKDITSDNLIVSIDPDVSPPSSTFFNGAYITTGSTVDSLDTNYKASGVVNYQNDSSSISINVIYGDISTDQGILNDITFESTPDASSITHIQTDHIYNAYVGETFRLAPILNKGGNTTLSFSISPDLPSGLFMNSSTGVIEGTPNNGIETKNFTVTVYNDSGFETHDFKLKVHEHFKLRLNLSSNSLSNAILHKEGQGHSRSDCRVTLDQINNDPKTDTKDILCYIDIGEHDLQKNGLALAVETSGICPFVEHLPFGFFKKQYKKSDPASKNVFQATGAYQDEICKNQWNSGNDIPEYHSRDGTQDGNYGQAYTSSTELCDDPCDDGQITVNPVNYIKSGEKKCFTDTDGDGFYDYTESIDLLKTSEASCDTTTDSWNYICDATNDGLDAFPSNCTGSKLSCMSGPLSKLTELSAQDITDRIGVVTATNSTQTFNYDAPDSVNDSDITSDLNIYLANFTKSNQCKAVLSNGQSSSYIYNDISWDAITKNADANDATAGKFNEANPFYTYNCLNNSGEIKARIRLLVREWNKPFTADSSIDLINPDDELLSDNMDGSGNIDDNYIGTGWNQFADFDDASSGYNSGAGSNQCTATGALEKYGF